MLFLCLLILDVAILIEYIIANAFYAFMRKVWRISLLKRYFGK